MAVVIPFRSARPSRRSVTAEVRSGRSAEILFFTGVRYERQDDKPAQPRADEMRRTAPRSRKRVKQQA